MAIQDRKLREKEEKRRLILDTAMKLFVSEGFANVSTRKIGQRIEFSPTLIYFYFKSKEDILHTLYIEGFQKLFEILEETKKINNPLKRLEEAIRVSIDFSIEQPEYLYLMLSIRPDSQASDFKWDQSIRVKEFFGKITKEAADQGYIEAKDLELLNLTSWAYNHGISSLYTMARNNDFPYALDREILHQSVKFFIKLIAKKKK
ncbi:MAG: TetR/AcrR family transcriptional regulator [Leptospiraceae bacterium]|nr:TetR/AcrR family transcriptional regulator [Leptospiraceae bacterium]